MVLIQYQKVSSHLIKQSQSDDVYQIMALMMATIRLDNYMNKAHAIDTSNCQAPQGSILHHSAYIAHLSVFPFSFVSPFSLFLFFIL